MARATQRLDLTDRSGPMMPEGGSPLTHRPARTNESGPELRLFISSTFRDMQPEREQLIKNVFPELRLLCRERGVEFTEIDLRWGIIEEATPAKVLRICLEEIDRCRPYFLGLLGDRYGWVPSPDEVRRDEVLLGKHPWLENDLASGRSVTEIEMRYGVLRDDPARQAHFYLRSASPTDTPDTSHDARLLALKEALRRSGKPLREFATPEELGRQVRDDLRCLIDRQFPVNQAPTLLEQVRRDHAAFAASRRRAYIENSADLEWLDRHVDSDGPPLIVLGDSGIGKSALMACWTERYRRHRPNALVVTHYLGASAAGGDVGGLLWHVESEIASRDHAGEAVPNDPQEMERQFPRWLERTAGERFVLVLDGLNQLDGQARNLSWLPRKLPANVSLIVSTLPGPTLDALRRNGWAEHAVQPLTESVRDRLIDQFLADYGKTLNAGQRRRIVCHASTGNAFFLRSLLEELRVFGRFEELDQRIDFYLQAPDAAHLCQRMLQRMEGDYGAELLREVMCLIWGARRGLTETELLELTNRTRLELSHLLNALDFHLLRRQGRLAFFHDCLSQAVRQRYLCDSADERSGEPSSARKIEGRIGDNSVVRPPTPSPLTDRERLLLFETCYDPVVRPATPSPRLALHRRLAAYFEKQPLSLRRVDELPWQLQQAEEWERLRDSLADMPTFGLLIREENQYELRGYWIRIEDRFDLVATYQEALDRHEAADRLEVQGRERSSEEEMRRRLENILRVGRFFNLSGRYGDAERLLQPAAAIAEQTGADALRELQLELQTSLKRQLRYPEAAELTPTSSRGLGRTRSTSPGSEGWMRHGTTSPRSEDCRQAYEADVGYRLWAEDFRNPSERRSAISMYRWALSLWGKEFGAEFTNEVRRKLGRTLAAVDEFTEAERVLHAALDSDERQFGADHAEVAEDLHALANLHTDKGELEPAESCFRRALAIRERVLGPMHPSTATVLNDLSLVLAARGRRVDALEICGRALQIAQQAYGPEHKNTQTCRQNLERLAAGVHDLRRCQPDDDWIARMLGERQLGFPLLFESPTHPQNRIDERGVPGVIPERIFSLPARWQDEGVASRNQAFTVLVWLGLFHLVAILFLILALWNKH
jgi:nephrocystin-3